MSVVVVRSRGKGHELEQDVTLGTHRLVAELDGPHPFELLLAALGSCTATSLSLHAMKERWPLECVVVRLRTLAVPGECARIEREVLLQGPLDAAQRRGLLEVADTCPVHQALTGKMKITTHESVRSAKRAA